MKIQKVLAGITAVMILASLCYAPVAMAEKGGNAHGNDKHQKNAKHGHNKKEKHGKHGGTHDGIVIDNSDQVIIKQYLTKEYAFNCPPGLAKKNNGCLPPGQAKKRYNVGQSLPDYIVWQQVPRHLLGQLRPVAAGYQYVVVDKDVLLISEASRKVIDAITLLSAVGH